MEGEEDVAGLQVIQHRRIAYVPSGPTESLPVRDFEDGWEFGLLNGNPGDRIEATSIAKYEESRVVVPLDEVEYWLFLRPVPIASERYAVRL